MTTDLYVMEPLDFCVAPGYSLGCGAKEADHPLERSEDFGKPHEYVGGATKIRKLTDVEVEALRAPPAAVYLVTWENYPQGVYKTFEGAAARVEERCPSAELKQLDANTWADSGWRVRVLKMAVR